MSTVNGVPPPRTRAPFRTALAALVCGVLLAGCTSAPRIALPGPSPESSPGVAESDAQPPAPAGRTAPSTEGPTAGSTALRTQPPLPSTDAPPTGADAPEHVVIVIFENKSAGQVVGSRDAPYLNGLADEGAVFTDAHGETHPSQPNYLALFSGSTHGVTSDACPQRLTGRTLAGELLAAGKTFVGYSEDLPTAGFTGCTAGGYARKHNPWVNFDSLPASINQPLTALPADFADLPTVAVIVPNLCHDMHNCGVIDGDRWARQHLAGYVAWASTHASLLIVTFDEGDGAANHIPTFVVGPQVRAMRSNQRIDHYSILRTVQDCYGLAAIGQSRAAQPLTGIWRMPG